MYVPLVLPSDTPTNWPIVQSPRNKETRYLGVVVWPFRKTSARALQAELGTNS
jgi:hypothetical protein